MSDTAFARAGSFIKWTLYGVASFLLGMCCLVVFVFIAVAFG